MESAEYKLRNRVVDVLQAETEVRAPHELYMYDPCMAPRYPYPTLADPCKQPLAASVEL